MTPNYCRRPFLRRGIVVLTVGLAGCNEQGGTEDGRNSPTATAEGIRKSPGTVTPTTTLTPTPTPTSTPTSPGTTRSTPTPTPTEPASSSPTATSSGTPNPTSTESTAAAKIAPEDGDATDSFGGAIALDDTTAILGASVDEDPNGKRGGAAYVFERSTGGWRQQAKLTAADGDSDDRFGTSVAVAGDTALVGAPHDEDPAGGAGSSEGAGSAYVYERTDGSWRQQAKLAASDRDSEDAFGATLTIAGDRALVGAPFDEDPNGSPGTVRGGGSVYVFERANGTWDQVDKFAAEDGNSEDLFGGTISYDGETALVGAPGDDSPNGKKAGSAYVFAPSDTGWQQRAKLAPNDGDADDAFGAVTLDGTTALVGAPGDEDPNGDDAGSAYVFERSNSAWSQAAKLVPSDGDTRDLFGASVALAGDTALIGAPLDEDPNGDFGGSAYVFERSNGRWRREAKLTPGDGDSGDLFGDALAFDSSTALVGASHDEDPNGNGAGSAYVFER